MSKFSISEDMLSSPIVWIALVIAILVATTVSVVLELLGITREIIIIVDVLILISTAITDLIVIQHRPIEAQSHKPRFILFPAYNFMLRRLQGSKLDDFFDLTTNYALSILTRYRIGEKEFRAVVFDNVNKINTERGEVSYYVGLARLLDGKDYKDLILLVKLVAQDIRQEKLKFDFIAGVLNTGSHIGMLVAIELNVPFLIIDKNGGIYRDTTPGDHVKGYSPKENEIALLFDDSLVTGQTHLQAAKNLRHKNLQVYHVYAFLDKQYGGKEVLAKDGITTTSFLNTEIVARGLAKLGLISKEDANTMLLEAQEKRSNLLGT